EIAFCSAWTAAEGAGFAPRGPLPSTSSPNGRDGERLCAGLVPPLEEPDIQFGRLAYWDESYRRSLDGDRATADDDNADDDAGTFS
ncbi:hypothetical protein ACHAWF_004634, partial [Thalassiosira exigua]